MEERKAKVILVDGPSGAGKGALIRSLAFHLGTKGLRVKVIAEEDEDPNRGEIKEARKRGGDREAVLVLISHRKEIDLRVTEPALEQYDVVIKDRGEASTEAYQTVSGEISMEEVYQKHREAGIRVPDLVVILNCSPEVAATRMAKDTGSVRQEREKGPGLSGNFSGDMERRQRIYERYKELYPFYREKGINVLMLSSERLSVPEETSIVLEDISARWYSELFGTCEF